MILYEVSHEWIIEMYVFIMYIMRPFIFDEKVEKQDQNTLSLNPGQKSTILFLYHGRYIGPLSFRSVGIMYVI